MASIRSLRSALHFFSAMALLLAPSLAAHGAVFTNIVAFGDSLSDNGNIFRLTAGAIPDSSYFEGRFSNGPVWVEYLAAQQGAELDDFAYGGASTGSLLPFPPDLGLQIAIWQVQGDTAQSLFTVWAGANDYLRLEITDAQGPVENVLAGLETLAMSGVSSILLLNLPDLGQTPSRLTKSPEIQAEASAYSHDFNQGIAQSLPSFSGRHPGVVIYFLDVFALFGELVANPEIFGFHNSTDESPNFGVDLNNAAGYVFWDDVHPTTEAHALLAEEAAALLSKDCAKVNDDLSMNLFFVEFAGMRFGFTLNHIGSLAGDPEGTNWEMDPATLHVEPNNILGIDHVVAGEDLDLIVPCAEFSGTRYAFRLDFVENAGGEAFLWRLDVPSVIVK